MWNQLETNFIGRGGQGSQFEENFKTFQIRLKTFFGGRRCRVLTQIQNYLFSFPFSAAEKGLQEKNIKMK